jgi:hypothetical protein
MGAMDSLFGTINWGGVLSSTMSWVGIILFIISIGLLLQFTLLPGLVQKKLIQSLNESGFSEAQVKVKSVTYWGAELENLNIGLEKKFHIIGMY